MFDEDLTVFFDAAEFAEAATWSPASQPARQATVILDRPDKRLFGDAVLAGDAEMSWPVPMFPGIKEGDEFVIAAGANPINAGTWRVRTEPEAIHDGQIMRCGVKKIA